MTAEALLPADPQTFWGSCGNYPTVAPLLEPVATDLVGRLAAGDGDELLDVAAGTGNVALAAAGAGACVTALDLTPELLAAGRARAGADRVTWVEGDAEHLPFPAGSFDLVASCFGVMFAPDQQSAVAELVRVCRPGGRIAVCAWTPEGYAGRWSSVGSRWVPAFAARPDGPMSWGDPAHVKLLFADHDVELEFEYAALGYRFPSLEAFQDCMEANSAPYLLVARAARAEGAYSEAREAMLDHARAFDAGGSSGCDVRSAYLVTTVRRAR